MAASSFSSFRQKYRWPLEARARAGDLALDPDAAVKAPSSAPLMAWSSSATQGPRRLRCGRGRRWRWRRRRRARREVERESASSDTTSCLASVRARLRGLVKGPQRPDAQSGTGRTAVVHVDDGLSDRLHGAHDERPYWTMGSAQGLARQAGSRGFLLRHELESGGVVREEQDLAGARGGAARADPILRRPGPAVQSRQGEGEPRPAGSSASSMVIGVNVCAGPRAGAARRR